MVPTLHKHLCAGLCASSDGASLEPLRNVRTLPAFVATTNCQKKIASCETPRVKVARVELLDSRNFSKDPFFNSYGGDNTAG